MNWHLTVKKYILVGMIINLMPANLHAAWYHSVGSSFKENIALIASVAVGATALLGTALYVRSKNNEIARLEKENNDYANTAGKLHSENWGSIANPAHCASCEHLKEQVRRITGFNTEWQTEGNKLRAQNKGLLEANAQVAQQNTQLQAARTQLQTQLDERTKALHQAQNIVDRTQLSATAQLAMAKMVDELDASKAENRRLTQAMESAQAKATANVARYILIIEQLEKAQAVKDQELAQLRKESAAYAKNLGQLTQYHNEELQEHSKRLHQIMQSHEIQALQNQFGVVQESNWVLQNDNPRLMTELERQRTAPSRGIDAALAATQSAAAPKPTTPTAHTTTASQPVPIRPQSPADFRHNAFARLSY